LVDDAADDQLTRRRASGVDDLLQDERRKRVFRRGRHRARHERAVDSAERHVADQRLLGLNRLKELRAGGSVERPDRRMPHERRGSRVDAAEILVQQRRRGGRNRAGLGAYFLGALAARLEGGPEDGNPHQNNEDPGRPENLAENRLPSKNLQGVPSILSQKRVPDARLREPAGSENAAVTSATGKSRSDRIVAAVSQRIVKVELDAAPDDVRLAQ